VACASACAPLAEAEKRIALGQPPAAYDKLTEAQKGEYNFARFIGISEADAMKLANMVQVGCNVCSSF
jgi:hypothetical protein